ncbi:MAG: hypothetical protein HYV75_09295, partial [Opitutae bacterium]|nr:hypothetical protein [Opitutae bacterium]
MIAPPQPAKPGFGSFRTRLLLAMMVVVTTVTALALFFAQRNLAANVRRDLEREFQGELASFHSLQEIRRAALAERCRALARLSRIHAALEDNALDLLYPSARDELRDVMDAGNQGSREPDADVFHARFYRFLDDRGAVISPPDARDVGRLQAAEEARLALPAVPDQAQIGYLRRESPGSGETIDEVIAMPIVSTESGQSIAALVLGFRPIALPGARRATGMISGIWTQDWLFLPAVAETARTDLAGRIARELASPERAGHSFPIQLDGSPCLLFYLRINPDSLFAPAYEVCIYPLTASIARQRRLVWQYSGAGGLLLLGAFIASHILARRLSRPVEKLAVDSVENLTQRQRAEA